MILIRRVSVVLSALALLYVIACTRPAAAQQNYTFTTVVNPLSTHPSTFMLGVNDGGVAVGAYLNSDLTWHSFTFSRGVFTPIIVPASSQSHVAYAINPSGVVVGQTDAGGFILSHDTYALFSDPLSTQPIQPAGINSARLLSLLRNHVAEVSDARP